MFAAALSPEGGARKLWTLSGLALLTNEQALKEAWENLGTSRGRIKCDPEAARARLTSLMSAVEIVPSNPEPSSHVFCEWELSDPDDVPILMAAINSKCRYLISNDSECFGPFYGKSTHGVTVFSAGKFLQHIGMPRKPREQ
jgi:predicted nucleic acid-binding protein